MGLGKGTLRDFDLDVFFKSKIYKTKPKDSEAKMTEYEYLLIPIDGYLLSVLFFVVVVFRLFFLL